VGLVRHLRAELGDVQRSTDLLAGAVASDPNVVLTSRWAGDVNNRVSSDGVVVAVPVATCVIDDERGVAGGLDEEPEERAAAAVVDDGVWGGCRVTAAACAVAHCRHREVSTTRNVDDLRVRHKACGDGVRPEMGIASADAERRLSDGVSVEPDNEECTEYTKNQLYFTDFLHL
jgi:hypothetical protein